MEETTVTVMNRYTGLIMLYMVKKHKEWLAQVKE